MYPKKTILLVFTALLGLSACKVVPKSLHEPVTTSPFIFKGTVKDLHASTIDAYDTTNLMVVSVDEILSSTDEFGYLQGQNITVAADQVDHYNSNQSRVFITDRWVFGKSVAVRNLGDFEYKDQEGMTEKIKSKILVVNQQDSLRNLRKQLKEADIVFTGKVMELKAMTIPNTKESEHDPQWMEAKIQVKEALKGMEGNQKEISVIFASSTDIMWFGTPKFKRNDAGVWMLSKRENEFINRLSPSKLFIVSDPKEFAGDDKTIQQVKKLLN